jgi:hypothetical protein
MNDKELKINVNKLKPTQICIGFEQVKEKEEQILSKNKKQLKKYLKTKVVPIIIGPNNNFYIIDHHHLSRAVHNLHLEEVYYKIVENWSELNENTFWNQMKEYKYVWLFDHNGNNINLDIFLKLLPKHIKDLQNDAFRSLAGIIRKRHGYNKNWTPFSEFQWANFFREENLGLKNDAIIIQNNIINKALELAKSDKAKNLPGYIS